MKVHPRPRRTTTRALLALALPLLCVCGALPGSSLAAAATPPQLSATPTSLDFGDVVMGTTSAPQHVKVTNVGTSAVHLTGTYGSSGPFTTTGNCIGATVPKKGTCQLTVTFAPANPGSFSTTLVNTFNGAHVNVGVRGNGYAKFCISPSSLDFGDVAVGDRSPDQFVQVTNVTSAPIQMSGSSEALGAFARVGDCQGIVLAPGDTCSMDYEFIPTGVGAATATDAGMWNGEQFSVALQGNAFPRFQITPTGLDFGAVLLHTTAPQQSVTVTNRGTSTVTMSGTNNGSGAFANSQDCQGVQLASGHSCHMYFHFTPTKTGSATNRLVGTWNGQVYAISLAGYGRHRTAPPEPFRVTPTSLELDSTPVGTVTEQDVTVTNQTAHPITTTGTINETGPFSIDPDCFNRTLASGQSCTLRYKFDPVKVATVAGEGQVTLSGQQFTIDLVGRGTRKFLVTPLALEFGPTHLNRLVSEATVSITNVWVNPITVDAQNIGAAPFGSALECPGGSLTLAAGASCDISYTFIPSAAGRATATANGTLNGQAFSVPIGGLGLADLAITPTGLAFVPQKVGTKSPAQTISVHNVSGHALQLQVTNSPAPANFIVTNTCGTSLAVGASCSYSVIFKPTSKGTKTGTLKATIAGQSLHVALTGTGK